MLQHHVLNEVPNRVPWLVSLDLANEMPHHFKVFPLLTFNSLTVGIDSSEVLARRSSNNDING